MTGKNKILQFDGCYHGHVDALLVKAGSGLATLGTSTSAGVPEAYARETLVLPLNDLDALEATIKEHADDLAVVAIEPIPANNGSSSRTRPSFRACGTCATGTGCCCSSTR